MPQSVFSPSKYQLNCDIYCRHIGNVLKLKIRGSVVNISTILYKPSTRADWHYKNKIKKQHRTWFSVEFGLTDPAVQKNPSWQRPVGCDKPAWEQNIPAVKEIKNQEKVTNIPKLFSSIWVIFKAIFYYLSLYTPAGHGWQALALDAASWFCNVPGGQGNSCPKIWPSGQ